MLLEEFLEPKGVTQAAFADKIGWTKTRLNELIKGKRGITAAAALDLADVLGTSTRQSGCVIGARQATPFGYRSLNQPRYSLPENTTTP